MDRSKDELQGGFDYEKDCKMTPWTENTSGNCPVPEGTLVDVIHRSGETYINVPALILGKEADDWYVGSYGETCCAVTFWRLSEVAKPTPQPVTVPVGRIKKPQGFHFCNKCGYYGYRSEHDKCGYYAVTSLADQYIEQQEQRIREIVGDYLLPEEDVVYGVARIKNAYTESNETREKFQRELNEVEEQLAEANRKLEAIYDIFDKAGL
jgi:hypothetical protein